MIFSSFVIKIMRLILFDSLNSFTVIFVLFSAGSLERLKSIIRFCA